MMDIEYTVRDTNGVEIAQDTHALVLPDAVLVIMVKLNSDGKAVVSSFEPLAVDNHNDTLCEIGGRVVTFAENGF
jgi:hypothetical protein